uniref:Uncharacterized protein n=1 Tax=Emiliania huxleyi TaxID=2903 RepID=A0A6U8QZE9_EMIHU|mmetsp:Transcript_3755/g.11018  ORF Transcript_3755/g.11018 Transcript_3755/m.11018 type:complete len:222 (+) Transcript_3755:81-746(+)
MARETPSFRVPGAGHWKLVAEREPAARPSPFGGETSISWAPALPGPHSIGEAPSDAGFMLYHVGDTLCFFDQRGAKADSTDTLQLRDRVLCHDLHWSCPPPGAGAGSSSANGGGGGGFGGASLEALVGLSSGEVVLWRPFSRRETSRGLSSAVAGGGEGAVADARWRPSPEAESGVCFGLAGVDAGGHAREGERGDGLLHLLAPLLEPGADPRTRHGALSV